jgi:hypothetical protein
MSPTFCGPSVSAKSRRLSLLTATNLPKADMTNR